VSVNTADSRLVWYGAALGALVGVVLVVIDNAVAKQPLLQVAPPTFCYYGYLKT